MAFTSLKQIEDEITARVSTAIEGAVPEMEEKAKMCGTMDVVAQVSIAISMKRIADFICGTPRNSDVMDYLARTMGNMR